MNPFSDMADLLARVPEILRARVQARASAELARARNSNLHGRAWTEAFDKKIDAIVDDEIARALP